MANTKKEEVLRHGAGMALAAIAFQTFGPWEWGLMIATLTAGVFTFQGLAHLLHWPAFPGYSASLLASTHPASGLAALALGMLVMIVVGSILLGRLRPEAGVFVAAVGMSALANRAGTVGAF